MTFASSPSCALLLLLLSWLLPSGGSCESCESYRYINGQLVLDSHCQEFCCGDCNNQYCCSDPSKMFSTYDEIICSRKSPERTYPRGLEEPMTFKLDRDNWPPTGPYIWHSDGTSWIYIVVGISIFVFFIVFIVICFTCSCCCLYKACRRPPRPVVTTTTATTFVHVPYPRQPGVPATNLEAGYQGYNPIPMQPQPGVPATPYPTQYPPPYIAQPSGPPQYHVTMTAGAGAPATQLPFNPQYMDPTKR